MEYFPLHPGETKCKLDIRCPELGLQSYELNLTAAPPLEEKPVYFVAHLGSESKAEVSIQNFTQKKADFTCSVSLQFIFLWIQLK